MLSAEFPMLTAETDISDDDTEIIGAFIKTKVNGVGENIFTSYGTSSSKHLIAQSPGSDAEPFPGNSYSSTNIDVQHRKNERNDALNELESKDSSIPLVGELTETKSHSRLLQCKHVESTSDTISVSSTCHSSNIGVQVGFDDNLHENPHTSNMHGNPTLLRNVTSIPMAVERKTSVSSDGSIRSSIGTSKDSIELNNNITEIVSPHTKTDKNNNLSKTKVENDVTTSLRPGFTKISSTDARQDEKALPLEVAELSPNKVTEGSLEIHNSHHRQQTSVELMTNQIVSMGTSRQETSQESFLITVPRNPQYLNSNDFSNNGGMPFATVTNDNQRSYGRRSIRLRLVEDKDPSEFFNESKRSFFTKKFSRAKSLNVVDEHRKDIDSSAGIITDLGTIVVSWYQGTTSKELQTHVRNSVFRKLGKKVDDIRLLDEDVIPHEGV